MSGNSGRKMKCYMKSGAGARLRRMAAGLKGPAGRRAAPQAHRLFSAVFFVCAALLFTGCHGREGLS